MKNLIILMVTALLSITAQAQTDSLNQAFNKIASLERQLQQHAQQIDKMSSDLNEVLSQNLALKRNLKLNPTIAKSKVKDKIEYRVLEVIGDKSTGDVHLVISVENIGDTDEQLVYSSENEIIDEYGKGYNDKDKYLLKIDGVADNLRHVRITHHVSTPYIIDMLINRYNQEAQYIKYLALSVGESSTPKYYKVAFENLPIKWVDELED